jgi:hypothetical protein
MAAQCSWEHHLFDAPGKTSVGGVYIFNRTETSWSEIGYLEATNQDATDYFGANLAVSGDCQTVCVGAPFEDSDSTIINQGEENNDGSDNGAVYVFAKNSSGVWVQQAYIKAANGEEQDLFGGSTSYRNQLALSHDGNILAVAASEEDGGSSGINGVDNNDLARAGAVYVFSRIGTNWTQVYYIKAPNPDPGSHQSLFVYILSLFFSRFIDADSCQVFFFFFFFSSFFFVVAR